jgi:hypothetical protein
LHRLAEKQDHEQRHQKHEDDGGDAIGMDGEGVGDIEPALQDLKGL